MDGENPYKVGDTVLASRVEDGEDHEEARVVDSYSLIIGGETRPMVCVQFGDGERVFLTAREPDVMPVPEEGGPGDAEPDG